MQFAKDSFYMALRERLAALNPARTVALYGATFPAVIVMENEPNGSLEQQPDAFYISWGSAKAVKQHEAGLLMEMECTISFYTLGTVESGVDRGRLLGTLEDELLSICRPPQTSKQDFTQSPSVDLGTGIFWTTPALDDASSPKNSQAPAGGRLQRQARLSVFCFPEVNVS